MSRDDRYGIRAIASALAITADQARLALSTGLLPSTDGRTTTPDAIAAALTDRDDFLTRLADLRGVDAREAARILGLAPGPAASTLAGLPPLPGEDRLWPVGAVRALAARMQRDAASTPSTRDRRPTSRGGNRPSSRGDRTRDTTTPAPPPVDEGLVERQRLRVRVAAGVPGPATVTIHAGPTNSGKTHDAIAALAATGRGVYAGPLRMLAREAATKLAAIAGADNVGLVTGEEQENPDAPIICATVEAAPLRHGGILILDETHWLSDPDRGWAWTRALIASEFEHIHVICDPAAIDMITALVPDAAHIEVVTHTRLAALEHAGTTTLEDVPDGAAVVVFSRAAVLATADALAKAGRRPAVLYGALPPAARADQVQRLIDGDADVIVTTDVIGHGINLPVTAVVLAETAKYDGTTRRDLLTWEAAQILGRAGRYGHGTGIGQTYALTGSPWFTPDERLVEIATRAAAGITGTGWRAPERASVRPTLGELAVSDPVDLPAAVASFARTIETAADRLPIATFDPTGVLARLAGILAIPGARSLPTATIWGLVMCPVDDDQLPVDAVGAILEHGGATARLTERARIASDPTGTLADAEAAANAARNLRAATLAVGDLPGITNADAAQWEHDAGQAVCRILGTPGALAGHGQCASCGRACAPWFPQCDACHRAAKMAETAPRHTPSRPGPRPAAPAAARGPRTGGKRGGRRRGR